MTRLEVGVTFRLRLPQQQKMLGYEDPHLHDPHGYRRESGENGALKQQEINLRRVENNITKFFSKSCQIKYSQLLNVSGKKHMLVQLTEILTPINHMPHVLVIVLR